MTTYFYKENKKVTLTPDKRECICKDIKGMLKKWYKDLEPSRQETAAILQKLFPESNNDKIDKVRGMDICFVTTAKTDEEAREEFYEGCGARFQEIDYEVYMEEAFEDYEREGDWV